MAGQYGFLFPIVIVIVIVIDWAVVLGAYDYE